MSQLSGCMSVRLVLAQRASSSVDLFCSLSLVCRHLHCSRLTGMRPPAYNIPMMLQFGAFVSNLSTHYHPMGPWMCPLAIATPASRDLHHSRLAGMRPPAYRYTRHFGVFVSKNSIFQHLIRPWMYSLCSRSPNGIHPTWCDKLPPVPRYLLCSRLTDIRPPAYNVSATLHLCIGPQRQHHDSSALCSSREIGCFFRYYLNSDSHLFL